VLSFPYRTTEGGILEITKQQFIDKFTENEFVGILTASKTDVQVEGWLFRFNNADNPIDTLDPRTVHGLELFVSKGLLTQIRAEEILGTVQSWNGWSIGQSIRVLPPFTGAYPDTYTLIGIDPIVPTLTITGGAQFAPQYLEVV
jgi:hypothetical protein